MLLDNQQPMRLTQQHQQPQLHQRFSQNHHQQQQQLMDLEREAAEPWLEQLHQQTAFGEITSQSGSRPGTAQLTEQAQQLQQILSSMSTRAALAGSTLSVAAGQHPQQQATESGSRRRTLSTASVDQPCSRRVQFTMGSPLRLISMPGVHIALEKEELWRTFFRHGNEMILTKKGRRLFPTPSFTITGLPEHRSFSIVINFVPASKVAHRYVGEAWAEVPTSKSLDCNVVTQFVHNSSPALGSVWVEHPFMFDFKITNNEITSTTSDAVLLHALHKYIFCVQVFEPLAEDESSMLEVDLEAPAGANRMHLPGHRLVHSQLFEETQFIAVTAYCNPNIRALKISHNPFARAFTDRARGDIETARALTQALENQDDSSAGEASPIPVAMVGPQRAPVRRSSFGGADMLSPATTDDGTPLRPQFLPLCFEPERSRSAALSSAPTPPTPIPTRITARRNRTVSEMDAVDSTASLSPAHSLASRNHTPSPMIQQGSTAFPFTTLPSASPKRARLDHSQGLRSITSLGGGARKLSFESMYSSDFSDLLLDAQRMFSNANARNSGHGGLTTSASCSSMASTNSRSAGLPHLSHTYFPGSSADSTPLPTPGLGHSGTQGTQPTARPRVMSISQNRANWDAFQHATQSANLDSANTSTVEELEGLIGAVARSAKEAAIEMMTKMHATSPQFRSSEEYAHQVKLAMNDAKIQIVVCDLAVFTPTTLQRLRANPVSADLSLMVVVPPNTLPSLIDSILASGVEDVLYEPLPPALLKQHLVRCIERRSWHAYM
ncbi:hypothetical protein CAOG_007284 [Capsaspora owczarzaki ATCC 30864]|uniref:T-box domain-containing protein n=3 Tax=Capsaspora owczarzaki TaxID=192875 RepID=A0A0D2VZV8_CAPO3|nr:hypothetical protein CAOG_007284 [Capsaspora owczarzaki ATCC 30864]